MPSPAERSEAVALKEYVDQRIADMNERLATDLRGREKALELAERNLSSRLDHLNEWRQQNLGERLEFARRDTATQHEERLRAIELSLANYAGRFWAFGVGAALAGGALGLLIRHGGS